MGDGSCLGDGWLRVGGVVLVGWGGGGGIYPPVVGGDIGAGAEIDILGVFWGVHAFLVVGGMDIPAKIFWRCTAVKTAF